MRTVAVLLTPALLTPHLYRRRRQFSRVGTIATAATVSSVTKVTVTICRPAVQIGTVAVASSALQTISAMRLTLVTTTMSAVPDTFVTQAFVSRMVFAGRTWIAIGATSAGVMAFATAIPRCASMIRNVVPVTSAAATVCAGITVTRTHVGRIGTARTDSFARRTVTASVEQGNMKSPQAELGGFSCF